MPSSIEILEPAEVVFNIQETTNFLSDLAARLHKYDDLAKIAKFQIQELSQRLQQFQKPIVKDAIQPIKITMDAKKEVKKGKVSKSKKK
jgi:SAM-dependent MidA family methyltransferase